MYVQSFIILQILLLEFLSLQLECLRNAMKLCRFTEQPHIVDTWTREAHGDFKSCCKILRSFYNNLEPPCLWMG